MWTLHFNHEFFGRHCIIVFFGAVIKTLEFPPYIKPKCPISQTLRGPWEELMMNYFLRHILTPADYCLTKFTIKHIRFLN